jgi:pimeloyl-ACP methyl ester carboxylesterase
MTTVLPDDLDFHPSGNSGAPIALVLHGGGGPQTVAPIVEHLAISFRTLAPTHPGWNGTFRPADIASVAALATAYLERLLADGNRHVLVVGSSVGGWIALEMAVQAGANDRYAGVIAAVINIDGVGVVVDGEPIADFFALDARGLAEVAWHNPDRGYMDPAAFTEQQRAMQQSNAQTMAVISGPKMSDPSLLTRLRTIDVPVLVVFGESDRVVTPAYGRAVSAAIPGAKFVEVPAAGHLPHLENPEATWAVIAPFVTARQPQ